MSITSDAPSAARSKPFEKRTVVEPSQDAPKRLPIARCDGAGFRLAQPDLVHHRPSSSSPLRGRQKFPEAISFSASISSAESASSRFSRRFSSSSPHIFATSLTSRPPKAGAPQCRPASAEPPGEHR